MAGQAFQVEETNTYVRIFDYDKQTEQFLRRFCIRSLARWGKVPGETYGSYKFEISHVFATFSPDKSELRLIKGFYQELVDFMKLLGSNIEGITPLTLPTIEPKEAKFNWKSFEVKPRNQEQQDYLDFTLDEKNNLVVINGTTGFGKSLNNDTPVQTPSGWCPIGSLKVGDEVISRDGSVTRVTGVYPQGELPVNEITFWDGRKSYCCGNHLWKVFDAHKIRQGTEWDVLDTREIKRRLKLSQPRLYIPLVIPYDPEAVNLPIDPYLFGALLGDGGFSVLNNCSFTNNAPFVVDKVNGKLNKIGLKLSPKEKNRPYMYNVVSLYKGEDDGRKSFFNTINDLKLHVLSIDKKIPDIFLKGSKEQRLELLRGLMDTDGDVVKGGTPTYSTSSEQLAMDVQRLVRSLGGIARISSRTSHYTWKGERKEGRLAYRITIRHPEPESIVTLPRRLERLSNDNQYASDLKLRIRSIEPAGVKECTCISVSHPDKLFVIDDYVVTHNTVVAIMAFVKLEYRVVITVLPRYVPIWFKAFGEFLSLKPEDVLNVSDHDINKIYEALKNGTINPKVVFFQLTRIDTYIKRMREAPDTIPHLDDFFKAIAPGVRLIDEAHESIYSVYTSMLYGNIFKNIGLSATLRGDDEFINKVYKGTFPDSAYLKAPIYEKYINVVSYYHRMNMDKYRINTKGFGGYSHVLYEKGILKKASIFENYYQMCKEAFIQFYIEGKRDGQKAMWFFATVAMCNRFCDRLKQDYPELDIFVFTGEISKKKGMEQEYNNHEVVITTPGSCATGKDVERLYVVFAGISVSSMQRVDQMSGRTRPITKWWPDLDPIFLTFVCRDVRKQVEYDGKKKQIISKKAKKFTVIDSGRWC